MTPPSPPMPDDDIQFGAPAGPKPQGPRRPRVLIVEDDADLLQIISALAQSMNIEPITAADGHAAVTQFSTHRPDLCLIDILLPLANGFEVCRKIKTELGGVRVPVVMMSSVYRTIDQIRDDLVAYGADDFVAKPFTMVQLQELIRYYLPRDGALEQPLSESSTTTLSTDVRRVLVIEDDEDLNDVISQALRTAGHEVRQAWDGVRGLDAFAAMKPDICLVDILLPELNGLEVCRQIKAARGDKTRVLLMSALARNAQEAERDRRKYGADAYLAKPFSVATLRAAVEELVRNPVAAAPSAPHSTGQEAASALPLQGKLAEFGIARLLATIFVERRSGTLHLKREGTRKEIIFINGVPVAARSNAISEALGSLLIARGVADPNVINDVISHRASNRSLGEELLRRGVVQAETLNQTLAEQVRLRITNTFAMHSGDFTFDPAPVQAPPDRSFPQNSMELVREGLRRHRSMNDLASNLQALVDRIPTRTPHFDALRPHFPLDEREARLVELIDGARTLGDLLQRRVVGVTDALYLLWGLYETRMIAFEARQLTERAEPVAVRPATARVPASEPAPQAAADPFEAQVAQLHRQLGQDPRKLLGLPPDADKATLRKALDVRVQDFDPSHPAVKALSKPSQDKARQIHDAFVEHLRSLEPQPVPREPAFKSGVTAEYRLSQGAIAHGVARAQMARGEYALALDTLERAVQLSPDDAALLTDHTWCRYRLGQLTHDDARQRLRRALSIEPREAQACYCMAVVEEDARRPGESLQWVERCLEIVPGHKDALAMRERLRPSAESDAAQSTDDARSMWNRLFGE